MDGSDATGAEGGVWRQAAVGENAPLTCLHMALIAFCRLEASFASTSLPMFAARENETPSVSDTLRLSEEGSLWLACRPLCVRMPTNTIQNGAPLNSGNSSSTAEASSSHDEDEKARK